MVSKGGCDVSRLLEVRELCLNRKRKKPISSSEKRELWSQIPAKLQEMKHFWELRFVWNRMERRKERRFLKGQWFEETVNLQTNRIFVIRVWMRRQTLFPDLCPLFRLKIFVSESPHSGGTMYRKVILIKKQ